MARRSMREQIVDAAVERFHARGFNAAGVKDITDTAGVPKGSFYNHFSSKEDLAVVALEKYGASRRLQDLEDTSVEPLVRLRRYFEFLREEIVDLKCTRGCLFGDFGAEIVDHSEVIREAVRQSLQRWATALSGAIREAQEAGTISADIDAETMARFILNAWEGALISARSDRSADALNPFFDVVFGTLLR
ncbi:TetR family transcriptional regulator C-terminal domain-containing protein [Actinopolymorpha pittospori]